MPNQPETFPTPPNGPAAASLLAGLLAEAREANPSDPRRVDQCIREALMLICPPGGVPHLGRRGAAPGQLSGLAAWQSRRIEAHVAAHLEGRLLVGELATAVRLSVSYFIRAFKVTFGVTPSAYIMEQRVLRAKTMMLSTGKPLAEVALACGLADQAHFCRLFRRLEGQSPAAWRRCHAATDWAMAAAGPTTPQAASAPRPS